MSSSNDYDTEKPAHRRSSRKNQSRGPTLQAQEPAHPLTHNDYDAPGFLQDHASGSYPWRPSPDCCPDPQPSLKYGASTLSNPPREPRAMRQSNLLRGGKKKLRAYPELQIEGLPKPPQNRYQQSVSYVDGVVQTMTDTLAILPDGFGAAQHLPTFLRESRPSSQNLAPPSPILQELQSNRGSSYFSIKSGLRATDHQKARLDSQTAHAAQTTQPDKQHPQELERSTLSSEQPAKQYFQGKESISTSFDEQTLVEAMQGLKIFGRLRPASEQSRVPPLDVVDDRADNTNFPSGVRIATGATQATSTASVRGNVAARRTPSPEIKGTSIAASFDENVKNVEAIPVNVSHEPPISNTTSDSSVKRNTPQAVEKLSVPSAHSFVPDNVSARRLGKAKHTSEECTSNVTPKIKQEPGSNSDGDSFEDIPLESAAPDSPSPPVQSSSSDDGDFEVVGTSKYQTQRNGRPGVWERWNQGKPEFWLLR
jgi:hypothetical protein